jgi:hypothetical protein
MRGQARKRIGKKGMGAGAITTAIVAMVVAGGMASAPKKQKAVLPDYVIKAQSVAVMILRYAREPLVDPAANLKSQEEVEKALMKWGRYRLTQEASTADLVIGVRKGTGKVVSPTIGGPGDRRGGTTVETTDTQIRIGVRPPGGPQTGDAGEAGRTGGRAGPGMESGAEDDAFEVFMGGEQYNANSAPVWTYVAKDGLKPPAVSAVDQFRKAVEEAEKAAQKRAQQQQKGPTKNP